MKLYLSSQKFGNHVEQLIALCGVNKNIAVIANGLDNKPECYRKNKVEIEIENLRSIGFIPEELDLRNYFGDLERLKNFLSTKSMVWIRGGSAFILNRAMIQSGFSIIGVEMIRNSKLVYAGYSAALIVATTNLSGTEVVDDPTVVPGEYSKDTDPYSGLGLIDFYLIPHVDSKEDWAKDIPSCLNKLRENKLEVVTLRDGEVFIVNDSDVEACGSTK